MYIAAANLSSDWVDYVTVKTKAVSYVALGGKDVTIDGLYIPQANGYLEIIGARAGSRTTRLRVAFSFSAALPGPSFVVSESEAVGTAYLPAACFSCWVDIAKSPATWFRIGGDGGLNALASDRALL